MNAKNALPRRFLDPVCVCVVNVDPVCAHGLFLILFTWNQVVLSSTTFGRLCRRCRYPNPTHILPMCPCSGVAALCCKFLVQPWPRICVFHTQTLLSHFCLTCSTSPNSCLFCPLSILNANRYFSHRSPLCQHKWMNNSKKKTKRTGNVCLGLAACPK